MKKKNLSKIALNKRTVTAFNSYNVSGGRHLPSNYENHGQYSDVHSDLVTLPVATNCPTDTFELSCICGGINNNTTGATPVQQAPASPARN
ncbi:hypothetical protein [uncultured Kordia sp.]|uniref:hypothetical protein n=1 Tax=uncultured Kordia sp. TaxID=507699 RepID=UPI00261D48D4|nr:hypothetical protein [uncultured Kordia sp.]